MLEKIFNLLQERLQRFIYEPISMQTIFEANCVVDSVVNDFVCSITDRRAVCDFIVEFENRNDMSKTGSACYYKDDALCVDPVQVVKAIKKLFYGI